MLGLDPVRPWCILSEWGGAPDARKRIFSENECVGVSSKFLNFSMIVLLFPPTWFTVYFFPLKAQVRDGQAHNVDFHQLILYIRY